MKKIYHLYADFETTTVALPEGYKNLREYFRSPNAKLPEIYSWCILYDNTFNVGLKHHENAEHKETKGVVGIEKPNAKTSYFISIIEKLNKDCILYFNNLRKFDGFFLIPELDKSGYTYLPPFDIEDLTILPEKIQVKWKQRFNDLTEEFLSQDTKTRNKYFELKEVDKTQAREFLKKQINRKWKLLREKEYSVLTNEHGHIYEIKIGLPTTKRSGKIKRNRALIVRDNLYLFPSSVKEMGKTIVEYNIFKEYGADTLKEYKRKEKTKYPRQIKRLEEKYFKLENEKGYQVFNRYKTFNEFKNDGNELQYLIRDVYILFKYHDIISNYFPRTSWRMTIGSVSYKEWVKHLGDRLLDIKKANKEIVEVYLKNGIKRIKDIKEDKVYTTGGAKRKYLEVLMPTKWLDFIDRDMNTYHQSLYQWMGGGITHVNEEYRGQFVEDVTVADINSSYPASMNCDVMVPYGRAMKGNDKNYPFKFYKLTLKQDITNKKGMPFLFLLNGDSKDWVRKLKAGQVFRFTSITYERFIKHYNPPKGSYTLKVEYSFKQIPIKTFFGSFIDKWYTTKQNAINPIIKMIAKLFLNSLYGKTATKQFKKFMVWDQEDKDWYKGHNIVPSKYYLPLGICITEIARMKLVDAVADRYKDFVYCDTDSIFMKNWKAEEFPHIELDPNKLGAWDIEFNGYGLVRRPKQYLFKNNDGKTKVAYAGVDMQATMNISDDPEDIKEVESLKLLTFEDMITGKTIGKKLKSFKVVGAGIVLMKTEQEIPPIWYKHYSVLREQKYFAPEHFKETLKQIKIFNYNNKERKSNAIN